MNYLYDGLWAIDPSDPSNVAVESQVTIFDPSDSAHTPIALTDPDGLPVPNPLVTNDKGFVGAFRSDLKRVGWIAAELTGYIPSFDGIIEELDATFIAANKAAVEAEEARVAAEKSANMIGIPTDIAVSDLFNTEGSDTQATADARYSKRGELEFNVRDYGAVGNGTVDDTAGVQAAIDACCTAGGGRVVVPPSTFNAPYRVGRLWIWADDVTFEVMPGVRMMRKGGTWGLGNRDGRDTSRMPLKDLNDPYSGPSNITVVGGVWDGAVNDEAYVPDGFNCHMFNSCRNITFRDMTIKDIVTNHALDMNGVDGMLVENCKFLGYKDATTDQSRNYTEAIQLSTMNADPASMGGFPLYSNGAATRGVRIRDCKFGASGTVGTQAWPTAFGNHTAINRSRDGLLTGDIKASGCTFDGLTNVAITIYTWDNVTIENNDFIKCKAGITANNLTQGRKWDPVSKSYVSAPLRENLFDIKVMNNNFEDTTGTDISIMGTGVSSVDGSWGIINKIHLSGNTRVRKLSGRTSTAFIRVLLGKGVIVEKNIGGHSSSGIAVQSCQDATIANNQIENTATNGILVDNTGGISTGEFPPSNADVHGNQTKDTGTNGISFIGILAYSAIDNTVRNHARIGAGSGVLLSGCDGGLASANRVTATSLPFNAYGINATGSTNTRITPDNLLEGLTTRVMNTGGAGTSYGPIQYT